MATRELDVVTVPSESLAVADRFTVAGAATIVLFAGDVRVIVSPGFVGGGLATTPLPQR